MNQVTPAAVMPSPENMKGFFGQSKETIGYAWGKTKDIFVKGWGKTKGVTGVKLIKGGLGLSIGVGSVGNVIKSLQQAWQLKGGEELPTNIFNIALEAGLNATTALFTLGPFVSEALTKFAPTRKFGAALKILNVGKKAPLLPLATFGAHQVYKLGEDHSLGKAPVLDRMTSFGFYNRTLRHDGVNGAGTSIFKPMYDWGRKFEKYVGIHRTNFKDIYNSGRYIQYNSSGVSQGGSSLT